MHDFEDTNASAGNFACTNCGAELKFSPGTIHLKCDYCGTENEIPQIGSVIEELDFEEFLDGKALTADQMPVHIVKCENCGASSTIDPKLKSAFCPYCATPLLISSAHDEMLLQPKSLLPFKIDIKTAADGFRKWVNKLWFAPNDLKRSALTADSFKGIYLPYWTYDSDTRSDYTGQRGTYYYVTETYTTSVNGKSVTKTRQVRKTRWTTVSGRVKRFFDDVLVPASRSLPQKYVYALEPWDLENLTPFDEKYLSGFLTEKYQTDLKQGFAEAKEIMDGIIRKDIRADIGGDEQRIFQVNTKHEDITFKHILLPCYVSAYRYKNNLFRFMVNARTGEVQGERPYSWIKITAAAIAGLAVIGTIIYFANTQG
jgi:DNA-directed RNA polymerase subunit RPC12/RpoP